MCEIDPDGQNLPMFLASLDEGDVKRFSNWVENLFGFGIAIERHKCHISIQFIRSGLAVNVADTGYGVSQILPVLAQVWWSTEGNRRLGRAFPTAQLRPITMEQPELHLHPARQAKIADVLVNSVGFSSQISRMKPIFLVETHSETLINRLGEIVELGMIDAKDIQIIIFDGTQEPGQHSNVQTFRFNQNGTLENWPFGFFQY